MDGVPPHNALQRLSGEQANLLSFKEDAMEDQEGHPKKNPQFCESLPCLRRQTLPFPPKKHHMSIEMLLAHSAKWVSHASTFSTIFIKKGLMNGSSGTSTFIPA